MWKNALFAAAVAAVPLQTLAATPASEEPAPTGPHPGDRPPDADQPTALKPVVVADTPVEEGLKAERQTTSSKLDLTIRETPQSVTVITQESLKERQVTDFGQALELSAGVSQSSGTGPFGGQAGFGFNETTIRGIAIDSLNDVRDDGFINSTYFAIPDMAIYDRIEIIKGPNSVTYGRGSAGGLINRIRKKPLAETRGELEVTAGAFDTYRADVDVTGPMTAGGAVLGRIVAAYSDEGAFVDGVQSERSVLAPSVSISPGPGTTLLLEGLYQRTNFIPNSGIPLVGEGDGTYVPPNIPRSLFVGVPNETKNRWSIYTGTAQLDQQLGDKWFATLRLNKNRTESPIATDRYAYGLSDTGDTMLSRSQFTIDRDIWAGELRISGELEVAGRPVKVATGVEYSENDYHRRGEYAYLGYANIYARDFAAPPDGPLTPGFEYKDNDKSLGYYVQAQVRPIERLSVLVGLRYDRAKSQDFAVTTDTLSKKTVDDVTGRVGVTYDINDNISVYGVYAQSFSPVLFSTDIDGNILDPETGEIYEAGLKTEWFDKRLGINTAIYRIDRENMPIAAVVPLGDPPYSISAGLQRSQGFEIEINGSPLPGWNISAAYNYLDSNFKDPDDPFFGAKVGGSANWQVGAFTSYELQSGPLRGLGAGATVFSIPDRGLSTFQRGTLEGYTRVDLNLFYRGLESYDFRLSIRNLTDERYIEGADRSGGIAQFGSPTAWLLSVSHRFGG